MTYAIQPLPFSRGAELDIYWPWTAWLPSGESVASYTLTPDAGVTIVSDSEAAGTVSAVVALADAAALGREYRVRCEIVTTPGGLTDSRYFRLLAADRSGG